MVGPIHLICYKQLYVRQGGNRGHGAVPLSKAEMVLIYMKMVEVNREESVAYKGSGLKYG